jgi:ABC-type transporter Mla MlaB component
MELYQHDSAKSFRFVLRGDLTGNDVAELLHAWTTAQSILRNKELVVDASGLKHADPAGRELLSSMKDSGARLTY